jgi:hypothetical protein
VGLRAGWNGPRGLLVLKLHVLTLANAEGIVKIIKVACSTATATATATANANATTAAATAAAGTAAATATGSATGSATATATTAGTATGSTGRGAGSSTRASASCSAKRGGKSSHSSSKRNFAKSSGTLQDCAVKSLHRASADLARAATGAATRGAFWCCLPPHA